MRFSSRPASRRPVSALSRSPADRPNPAPRWALALGAVASLIAGQGLAQSSNQATLSLATPAPAAAFADALLRAAAPKDGAPDRKAPDRKATDRKAADDAAIVSFYESRNGATLWTGAEDAARRAAFFAALDRVADHGLPAGRYDAAGLRDRFAHVQTEAQRARAELAVTRAFLTYARDVSTGFLTPSKVDPGIVRDIPRADARALLDTFAASDPAAFLAALPPSAPEYAELQRARLDLIAAEATGWGPTVAANRVEPGATGGAVVALRDRLVAQGYLPPSVSAVYDAPLTAAVKAFQSDHGLTVTGLATEGTIAEVNRSPSDRLASVLVAMERLRWMNGTVLGQRHIWVNLPDFTAKVVDNGKVTFSTDTVVGMNAEDRRSPEFSDEMQFMVVNPRWSVPRSITVKEYLPMLQRNPYAASQLRITDRSGREVDRSAVDFTQYTAANFPFSMQQPPSDGNALGLVKFMFPNPWNIYLHDTPQKPLFKKEIRAFSHGCIRLARPFDLAYTLLAAQSSDPQGLFKHTLATKSEAVLKLDAPVPVHLVYFTAWPDADGHIEYRRDVYGRDTALFGAMKVMGVDIGPVAPDLAGSEGGVEMAADQG